MQNNLRVMFYQHVYNLVDSIDVKHIYIAQSLVLLSDQMMLDVNMFGSLVKLWVMNRPNATLIVVEKLCKGWLNVP